MQKVDTIDDSFYNHLFEKLETYNLEEYAENEDLEKAAAEEFLNETILNDIKTLLEDEMLDVEPVASLEKNTLAVTRLSILNTVISAILPGYRLVLEVDEKKEKIEAAYLAIV